MGFKLEFSTENAAFEDSGEVARILAALANRLEGATAGDTGSVRDINGNTVGEWSLTDD